MPANKVFGRATSVRLSCSDESLNVILFSPSSSMRGGTDWCGSVVEERNSAFPRLEQSNLEDIMSLSILRWERESDSVVVDSFNDCRRAEPSGEQLWSHCLEVGEVSGDCHGVADLVDNLTVLGVPSSLVVLKSLLYGFRSSATSRCDVLRPVLGS